MKTLSCFILTLSLALGQTPPAPQDNPAQDLEPYSRQFVQVLSAVEAHSAGGVPTEQMVYEGAIPSMLRQLDPHTQFF